MVPRMSNRCITALGTQLRFSRPLIRTRVLYQPTLSLRYTTSVSPARKPSTISTLGPDAANATSVDNPARDKTGQILRISITESAAAKLHTVAAEDSRPNMVLRIQVESGGCHGFQYVFQLQDSESIKKDDSTFERDGAKVVIDHRSLRILRDATVDYATELIGSQFKVVSPHTSSSCGCGSSFSLDEEP